MGLVSTRPTHSENGILSTTRGVYVHRTRRYCLFIYCLSLIRSWDYDIMSVEKLCISLIFYSLLLVLYKIFDIYFDFKMVAK